MPYGNTVPLTDVIYPTRVSFDGSPKYKAGGITLDFTTLPAASVTDTTLPDGSIVRLNKQFLRYGQVLTKITNPATAIVTIGGGATGGTFVIPVTAGGSTLSTAAITYSSSLTAATVQAAVVLLANVGAGKATVTGSNGGPYTIVFDNSLGAVTVGPTISAASLTGGTPTATVTATAPGGDVGKFGPYDPAATDGRATLTRGECFILDETFVYRSASSVIAGISNDNMGGVIEGGDLYLDRIIQSGVATHTLAVGPTKAELLAAFPLITLVEN